jgi:choline dehydrogenase-like flavoprotein
MQVDARSLAPKTALDAEICVVGAGPAGITLAREFVGGNTTVAVIDSGGLNFDARIQELNEGTVIGAEYAGLRQTRCRQVGGTAHLWNTSVDGTHGAKYVPLDSCDFAETSDPIIDTKWPLNDRDLEPFYQRAHKVCSLGPFEYDGAAWADDAHPLIALGSGRLSAKVYQCGSGRLFTETYQQELATSGNICLCRHATLLHFRMSSDGRKVIEANCVSSAGTPFVVRASCYVLAAGAIENARLLLLSRESIRDNDTWIGRCFMEHPRDYALTLHPRTPDLFRQAAFFDLHTARDGTVVVGRIALDGPTLRRLDLPNASITLLPRPKAAARSSVARIAGRVRRLFRSEPAVGSYGWSRHANLADACDAFQLLINLEQRPNPDNRLLLARTRDAFGSPRVNLFWRWSEREQENLHRLRMVIASALEDSGLGRVEINAGLRPDPNAHHHSGTTRMHEDPRWGVTDADGRVHGIDNLFVTGSSIFCSAGFANPTLTIVAFALRLADHLKVGQHRGPSKNSLCST